MEDLRKELAEREQTAQALGMEEETFRSIAALGDSDQAVQERIAAIDHWINSVDK